MTQTSFAYRATTLLSPRTVKYVEAMVREGDKFDYDEWLKRVREEEAQANRVASKSCELVAAEIGKLMGPLNNQHMRPNPPLPLVPKTILLPRTLRRSHRNGKSQTTEARLMRWLEKVRRAWVQTNRRRDSVYQYLVAVFAIVMHYKVRRQLTKLLRHAFKFADLPFNKNADPFSAVIRCTCDSSLDAKMISKYARALRYASRRKKPDMRLKRFMKEAGGVNACAAAYAKRRYTVATQRKVWPVNVIVKAEDPSGRAKVKSEEPKHALSLVNYLRATGYKAWIEDTNGNQIEETALKMAIK